MCRNRSNLHRASRKGLILRVGKSLRNLETSWHFFACLEVLPKTYRTFCLRSQEVGTLKQGWEGCCGKFDSSLRRAVLSKWNQSHSLWTISFLADDATGAARSFAMLCDSASRPTTLWSAHLRDEGNMKEMLLQCEEHSLLHRTRFKCNLAMTLHVYKSGKKRRQCWMLCSGFWKFTQRGARRCFNDRKLTRYEEICLPDHYKK